MKYMELKPLTRKQELETLMLSRKGKKIVVSEPRTGVLSPSFMENLIFSVQKAQRLQRAAMQRDGYDQTDCFNE